MPPYATAPDTNTDPSADPTKLAPGEQWDATKGALAHAEATGVDIAAVEGTGKGGTVTKADVAAAAAAAAGSSPERAPVGTSELEKVIDQVLELGDNELHLVHEAL